MCGFAGFLQKRGVVAPDDMAALASRMGHVLEHRGPDDRGVWVDPASGIALAHQRLSIIDLSPQGHQPMHSASGRYVIAFNGEIYNFEALRKELADGNTWRGHSDTEVMLAAVDRWGVERALQRFNGMFAFALWDRANNTLCLARDRLGEKPLYYGWVGNSLLFASQLKALRLHPAWQGEIDRNALSASLRHNCVPGPHSIYKGIAKLRPAHYVKIAMDSSTVGAPQPYWSARDAVAFGMANPLPDDDAAATDELDALLRDAVKLRTVADVPLGVFLSGGVDSSLVTALTQAQATRPVKTFSIGFEEEGYNEAVYAKAVARYLGTDHTELYVTPSDAMSVIPVLARAYDEPFADSSQIPTLLVSQLARNQVTVCLSGDGGDELFCGYVRYFWGQRVWNNLQRMPYPLRRLARAALKTMSRDAWDAALRPLPRRMRSTSGGEITGTRLHKLGDVLGVQTPDEFYRGLVSHWARPDTVVRDACEAATALTDSAQAAGVNDFTLRMMFLDMITYLPDDILVKVDRASMWVSLESRVPLLDHRVVEYAWRVPLSMKLRNGQGKWLLRQVLHRYVPRELIERPKMGFGVPIGRWLKGPLRAWAEDLLDEQRLREEGYFDPREIRAKWHEHVAGRENWEYPLWDVLMFQAWLEQERTSSSSARRERDVLRDIANAAPASMN